MDTRTVTGRWLLPDGTPAQGHVWFTPTARLVNVADQTVVLPDSVRADLDQDGEISVVLPCTDDADLEPAGWLWQVDECLDQAPELNRRWLMVLPYGVGAVDVADVMSRDPLIPGPVWAGPTGPKGPKGDPTGVWIEPVPPNPHTPPADDSWLWVDESDNADYHGGSPSGVWVQNTPPDPGKAPQVGLWLWVDTADQTQPVNP